MAKQEQQQMQVDFTLVVNELANRLRILEGKQTLASEKMLVMNQNMIGQYKKTQEDMKKIVMHIKDVEENIAKVKNVLKHLTEEASKFAREDTVKRLEKYVDLWNPMNFVTEAEVKTIIERTLKNIDKESPKNKKVDTKKEKTIKPRLGEKIKPKTIDETLESSLRKGEKNA
jgi:hypothetical protein